jgi:2-alkenal reductase
VGRIVVVVVSAVLGGIAALGIGKAAGWFEPDTRPQKIVLTANDGPARPARAQAARPLTGNVFDPAAVYRRRAPGVVTIYALFGTHATNGGGAAAQGSGFVVSNDGLVLTDAHVVTTAGEGAPGDPAEPAGDVYVEFRDGERLRARLLGFDVFSDVAVVRIDPSKHALAPVPLGRSRDVVVGEPVAAIGSPFGNESSLTVGVVSAVGRSIASLTSCYDLGDAIQTDAPINRGNSGGPLFDAAGDVIGINAQIRSSSGNAEGVGFAVPIDTAKRSLAQLVATGRVRYAWMGISTRTLTPLLAQAVGSTEQRGALVESVAEDSPASRAGVRGGDDTLSYQGTSVRKGGDVIVAIDGRPVRSSDDVVRAIGQRLLPGQRARLAVVRGGDRTSLDVVLGERPPVPPGRAC